MCCEPKIPVFAFEPILHSSCPLSMHCSTGMPQISHLPSLFWSINCLASSLSKPVKLIRDILAGIGLLLCLPCDIFKVSIVENIEDIKTPTRTTKIDINNMATISILPFFLDIVINIPPNTENNQNSADSPKNIIEFF